MTASRALWLVPLLCVQTYQGQGNEGLRARQAYGSLLGIIDPAMGRGSKNIAETVFLGTAELIIHCF